MNPPNSLPSSPLLLPPGWVETWDATQQRNYYYHAETRATQWERPVPAVVPLPPPPLPLPLPLPSTVNTVPQPTVPFDPRRGNHHYQHQGNMRNLHGRDDAAPHQHSQQQQQPQPQQQQQAQYPYPAQVQTQHVPQYYQHPVAQQQQQPHQQYPQYYQQPPPHQQQLPYPPPGQPPYPSQPPPQPQQQQPQQPPWNNPAPHVIPLQQQQQQLQYPNHSNTNNVYSYNLAGNAMIRTAPVVAAGTVGGPSDPPQPPPPIGSTGGTGIYNAQQEFDELRAMTTEQIALLCKLQHEQESSHEQNNTPEENDKTNEKKNAETTKKETEDSASSSATSNAPQHQYTPIALSSMAYVSLAQHRTEPGRLIALLCKLQHELELHEQNNTPEET